MWELTVSTVEELLSAISNQVNQTIVVKGKITECPTIHLSPGKQLIGEGDSIIEFQLVNTFFYYVNITYRKESC